MTRHVVFVHGLNGSFDRTWNSAGTPPECWPDWLNRDDGATAVWGVNYGAVALKFLSGDSMHLPDRAVSLLPLLTATPELAAGDVILVGYSLGGLVIKTMLRIASDRKGLDPATASLLKRVRRIAFIATPHLGSDQALRAKVIKRFLREPVFDLPRNDANLRALNDWYRTFCDQNSVETLVLWENKESLWPIPLPLNRVFMLNVGHIVKPDSALPGVTRMTQFPIDADHFTIVAPADRSAPVFERLREFVEKPFPEEPGRGSGGMLPRVPGSSGTVVESPLITAQLLGRVNELRQSRYSVGFDAAAECRALFDSLDGEFALASSEARRVTAAWCARIAASSDTALAATMLARAQSLGNGIETLVARAFLVLFAERDREAALTLLEGADSPMGRTARAILLSHGEEPGSGLERIDAAGLAFDQLDADGKNVVLQKTITAGLWERGFGHAVALTDADFVEMPALLLGAAALLLASTVNDEFRAGIVSHLPTELSTLPMLGDAAAVERRRQARTFYARAAVAFGALGRARTAALAADYALWLGLIDPASRPAALEELRESMADREVALRRLPLALEFGLELDVEAIETELEQKELAEDALPQVAAARFALAKRQGSPAAAAAYIQQYRDQLTELYQPDWISAVEIELLARAGRLEEARDRLSEVGPGFPDHAKLSLERIIEEASGSDPVDIRERSYASSGSIGDLILLVDVLRTRGDWAKLVEYGRTLYETTRDTGSLEAYVQGLNQVGDDTTIIDLAQSAPEMFSTHALIQSLAWAYFRIGDIGAARGTLIRIEAGVQDANDRALLMNLSVASGDWSALNRFVEDEWSSRDKRSARELLQAGQLAQHVGSNRSRDLIRAAAAKADGNPALLAASYTAASAEGWEDSPEVHEWLANAIAASGDDGPIQRMDIRDVLSMQPEWSERESRTWDQLTAGQLPVFGAAHVLRRSLVGMFLVPALANLAESDPRRRGVVFAYSGARAPGRVKARTVAIDAGALLTLAFLGLLERTVSHFDTVFISHTLLGWLFEERQRLQFHQPSRVRAALEVKRLIDQGHLAKFGRSAPVDERLEREVGPELASLIAEAAAAPPGNQHVVIRPYPVHRPGTLLDENADVSGYEAWIAGCCDLVAALQRLGQLTRAEEEQAGAYLGLHERPWPHTTVIQPGATLYLDGLSVDYLQHLKLLGRLHGAGFSVVVAASEIEEGDALVRHQEFAERAGQIIEQVRAVLASGLADGRVRLGRLEASSGTARIDHPTATFFELAPSVDALIVDDRFLNRHPNIDAGGGVLRPIHSTLDLLQGMNAAGALSDDELGEAFTQLRRGGFVLIPVGGEEFRSRISSAQVVDGRLLETAELRAIRESFERVRMTDILQLPLEAPWLDDIHRALIGAIRAQWGDATDVTAARARSDWLLTMFDIRGWAHRTVPEAGEAAIRYRSQMLLLTSAPDLSDQVRADYWQWLEERLLARYREENPEDYAALQSMTLEIMEHTARNVEAEDPEDD